jgi:RecA/RadA recombinase
MIELELTYEQLYRLYGNGEHEVPYEVKDELFVKTPTGYTKINKVVTKHNNEIIRLDFDDGDKFECSVNHIFQDYHTGTEIDAVNAKEITSTFGVKNVIEKTPLGVESVYDISIDAPHWYIANPKSGIYHHNTFFSLAVVKNFLDNHPDGYCLYFDTESAITKSLLESRQIDTKRLLVANVATIEDFRSKALKTVDLYLKTKEEDRKPCMIVLDSLGMLSSNKEIGDALAEKDSRDMTKAQLIKGAFRMLTLKLGKANIPMLVTNHTYDSMSLYGGKQMSGGSGIQYAASSIVYLSKAKDKEGTEIVGNIITAKAIKSRLSKENQDVQVRLFYDERGLDRYYGLLQLGELGGLWKRSAGRYEFDGKKVPEKTILANPEKYFTDDVMKKLDEVAKVKFSYGSSGVLEGEVSDEED